MLADAGGAGIGNTSVDDYVVALQRHLANPADHRRAGPRFFLVERQTTAASDTLTAEALGIQATKAVNVSTDAFTFSSPAADAEVTLGTNAVVTVNWTQGGAAVAN